MSFLEHLDELRRRLVRSVLFIAVAFCFCWYFSDYVYNFLSVPVRQALAEAQRRPVPLQGLTGEETILPLSSVKEGDAGRYVFGEAVKLGASVIPAGASVQVRVARDRSESWASSQTRPSSRASPSSHAACVCPSTSKPSPTRCPASRTN